MNDHNDMTCLLFIHFQVSLSEPTWHFPSSWLLGPSSTFQGSFSLFNGPTCLLRSFLTSTWPQPKWTFIIHIIGKVYHVLHHMLHHVVSSTSTTTHGIIRKVFSIAWRMSHRCCNINRGFVLWLSLGLLVDLVHVLLLTPLSYSIYMKMRFSL